MATWLGEPAIGGHRRGARAGAGCGAAVGWPAIEVARLRKHGSEIIFGERCNSPVWSTLSPNCGGQSTVGKQGRANHDRGTTIGARAAN